MSEPEINFDSQWNMAAAYFYRIHVELTLSNTASRIGDYALQYQSLFNVHKELSGQMKPEELEKCERLQRIAEANVQSRGVSVDVTRGALYRYEIFLRNIMKLRKMDLPRSKDPSKAILDG